MVVLKTNTDINNFQWNINGSPPEVREENSPEHYSYAEQADYTPVVVLLDSADQPLEIGVFENDTCIGANAVNDGDSTVVIRSYTTNNSSDSLTFEKYYGSKSTQRDRVENYYVRPSGKRFFEKRKIAANERADFFVVSFRKPKEELLQQKNMVLHLYPNPVNKKLTVEYVLDKKQRVVITVYNTEGKRVAEPLNECQTGGTHQLIWDLRGTNGRRLKAGLYLVKITAGDKISVGKLMIR